LKKHKEGGEIVENKKINVGKFLQLYRSRITRNICDLEIRLIDAKTEEEQKAITDQINYLKSLRKEKYLKEV
jgi:hypothetical protein